MKLSWNRLTVPTLALATVGFASSRAHADGGGPPGAGYHYVDNDDGVAINPHDLTGDADTVDVLANGFSGVQDTEGTYTFPAGFSFELYGETLTSVVMSTDGFFSGVGGTPDLPNTTCPYPNGDLGMLGPRVYVRHEPAISALRADTFDAVEAAALGFTDAQGVTILQWTMLPLSGGFVQTQAILYHTSNVVEIQQPIVAGAGASVPGFGLENAAGDTALTLSCANIGGNTAWQFRPGPVPPVRINEIRIDQTGVDNDEYIELVGPPGASLDGMRLLVAGDTAPAGSGGMDELTDLTGLALDNTGMLLFGEASMTIATPDIELGLSFENGDNLTFFLAFGVDDTFNIDVDLDVGDDGILDAIPWAVELDRVAMVESENPPAAGDQEFHYGPPDCTEGETCQRVGPDGVNVPPHTFRCENETGTFLIGNIDPAFGFDSPGELNPCDCGDGLVIPSEECDDTGESATCDLDCTFAVCLDGTLNVTALEECDDGAESATCDDDCTVAMCLDGTLNVTALEECDDGAESATCDDDCTFVSCGDGTLNVTALEECDDGGESPTCNANCTTSSCGDGIVNSMAGETCDDSGRSATCNANCTLLSCGDGVVNTTAGEECDAQGESETCDDDCTDAICGDGVLNVSAGEECDDGNNDPRDGCSNRCVEEIKGGTTGGGDESTGGSGSDSDTDPSTGGESTGNETGTPGSTSAATTTTTTSSTTTDGDTGEDDTETDGAGASDDSGCGCTTDNTPPGWAAFGLFGLLGFRRRRSA